MTELAKVVQEMRERAKRLRNGSAEVRPVADFIEARADRIEAALASQPQAQENYMDNSQDRNQPVAWQHSGDPVIPKGTERYFIVAVRRNNGQVYTFPATFCNDYHIGSDRDDPTAASGNGWSRRVLDEHESDSAFEAVSGWFDCEASEGDYDTIYNPLLVGNEQVVAWQSIPAYAAPPAAAPAPARPVTENLLGWLERLSDDGRIRGATISAGQIYDRVKEYRKDQASFERVFLAAPLAGVAAESEKKA